MKRKKSQIQMGETISILLVFFILLILGIVFYAGVMKGVSSKDEAESNQLESIEIAQRISFLPELQCSQDTVKEEEGCIDILKLKAAEKIINQNNDTYFGDFGYSEIIVTELYPLLRTWTLYNRPREGASFFQTNIPVSLSDPIEKKYYFGILTVNTYTK